MARVSCRLRAWHYLGESLWLTWGVWLQLVVLLEGKAITEYTMHNAVLKTTCVSLFLH